MVVVNADGIAADVQTLRTGVPTPTVLNLAVREGLIRAGVEEREAGRAAVLVELGSNGFQAYKVAVMMPVGAVPEGGFALSRGRTLESFRPEAEAIVGARGGPSRILVMEDPGVRGSLNPSQDNIIFRELELSRSRINQTQPFNQALSDTGGQPIRVVVTQNGEMHIMQGNHRIYGAREQGLPNAEALIYTPEQWEVLTESSFVPRGTNFPAITP